MSGSGGTATSENKIKMLGEFNMQKIRKAVIPAAGYGTRFLPATKATPKEMLPIVDKPTIQYIVEEALASGIEEILIVSGHGKRAIEDHFDSAPTLEAELKKKGKLDLLKMVQDTANIRIHYIRQRYMRGLGDAILCAKAFMGDEPFAVLLGDDVVYIRRSRHCASSSMSTTRRAAPCSAARWCPTTKSRPTASSRAMRQRTLASCACAT